MAKSISLSTDMKTLYLIDSSGFSVAIPLTDNGAYITSIVNDIIAIPASTSLNNGTDECSILDNAQWNISFHEGTTQALMIGNDDITATVVEMKSFDLTSGNVINLRLNDSQTKILIRT